MSSPASSLPSARWLSPLEQRAWRAFVAVSSVVMAELENELEAAHGLSLGEYAVLVELSEAPDQRLRMSELAGRLHLSPSGLTRRLDLLVRDGMVVRESCPSDRRAVYAVLTPGVASGWRRRRPTTSPPSAAISSTAWTTRSWCTWPTRSSASAPPATSRPPERASGGAQVRREVLHVGQAGQAERVALAGGSASTRVTEACPRMNRSHSHGTGTKPSRWQMTTVFVPAWATNRIRRSGSRRVQTGRSSRAGSIPRSARNS